MTPALSDEAEAALISLAQTGDLSAFEALVRAHQRRVRLQLRRLARGDSALADDLAQETMLQAWRQLRGFRGGSRWATWLYRIACNQFLMHVRRRQELPAGLTETNGPDADAPSAGAAQGHSEQATPPVDWAQRLDVQRAIDALPQLQRLAIVHCFVLDLSHEEAAEVLGWPVGTLKSHVARAKQRLRETLAAWKPENAG